MKVYIKNRTRDPKGFQFFMEQFVEAAIDEGIASVPEHKYLHKSKLNRVTTAISKAFCHAQILPARKAVIVTSRGRHILRDAMPYAMNSEVIPMLWDSWPRGWKKQIRAMRCLNCKVCLITCKYSGRQLEKDIPGIKTIWIPEGIETDNYKEGPSLNERTISVCELGRQLKPYHKKLVELHEKGVIDTLLYNRYDSRGHWIDMAFKTNEDLYKGLQQVKILISFPCCDTHPVESGGVETLTQRYWEAMLCRCIIVGRSPQELIDLIGYDPVVTADLDNPEAQIAEILNDVSAYQNLVDRNLETARKYASWHSRMPYIKQKLTDMGYEF